MSGSFGFCGTLEHYQPEAFPYVTNALAVFEAMSSGWVSVTLTTELWTLTLIY